MAIRIRATYVRNVTHTNNTNGVNIIARIRVRVRLVVPHVTTIANTIAADINNDKGNHSIRCEIDNANNTVKTNTKRKTNTHNVGNTNPP